LFWDILGPDHRPREGDGVHWKEEKIENLDRVLEIGRIRFDIEDVSNIVGLIRFTLFRFCIDECLQVFDHFWLRGKHMTQYGGVLLISPLG
jgi:hypothetical protein